MKKEELIQKIKSTRSLVEFYKLKEDIIQALEQPKAKAGKEAT